MTSRVLSRRSIFSAAGIVAAAALLGSIPDARADGATPTPTPAASATIEVIVILASQDDAGGDDPRIATLPDLKHSPLKFFASRKLVEKPQVHTVAPSVDATASSKFMFTFALTLGQSVAVAVNNGPTMSLTLSDIVPPSDGKPLRYNISAELKPTTGASSKIGIGLSRHQRVFVGGPSFGSGTLFFGFHAKS